MGKRILAIFGTRPEAIKMAPVVNRLIENQVTEVFVCVTAQHRHLIDQVLKVFGIIPDFDLNVMKPEQDLCEITTSIITHLPRVFAECGAERVLVHGDTNTTFAAALTAYYHQIPVAHIEAGLRSNDIYVPWPEEINRKLTATIADIHFAPSELAKRNLMKEGVSAGDIVVTGNTVIDALFHIRDSLRLGNTLMRQMEKQFDFLDPDKRLILVTCHRRESFGGGIERVCNALAKLAKRTDVEIVLPVHPNPNVSKSVYRILDKHSRVQLIPPLEYVSFIYLLNRACLVITDSGGVQEEASAFGKPLLVTREVSDRPEIITAGTAKLVGTVETSIVDEANALLDDAGHYEKKSTVNLPYGDGKASELIVEHIERHAER